MDYAITLEFDKETENRIQELIDEVAEIIGCDYMKQSKIPPHVTVSALVSDDEESLLTEMESIAESACYLSWSGNERILAEYLQDSK